MAQPQPSSTPPPGDGFPRVPAYAWAWLQRSRLVVAEAAQRLTGEPPGPGFVEHLRKQFDADPFTRDILVSVIADVAFNGRIPRRRPAGASWDRGLIWWAATIAGVTVEQFEGRQPPGIQSQLFGEEERSERADPPAVQFRPRLGARTSPERTMLVAMLRDVLSTAENGRVPVEAIEHLLAQLEGHSADPASRQ